MFERIQRDIRHPDVTVLELKPAAEREIPLWEMAFAGHLEEHQVNFSSLAAAAVQCNSPAAETLSELLHDLVRQVENTK